MNTYIYPFYIQLSWDPSVFVILRLFLQFEWGDTCPENKPQEYSQLFLCSNTGCGRDSTETLNCECKIIKAQICSLLDPSSVVSF